MANRAYLYSIDHIPDPKARNAKRRIVGISEWNYEIPIVYALLLSGNTQTCRSLIWDAPEDISILADYDAGVERLQAFMEELQFPPAEPLFDQALTFLKAERNRNTYFHLEPLEIYDLMEDEPPVLNRSFCKACQEIELSTAETIQHIQKLVRDDGVPDEEVLMALQQLGFGNWSNILYWDLNSG